MSISAALRELIAKRDKNRCAYPITGETVHLFHPINQQWDDHFCWDESKTQVIGLTPCGRATVVALRMNNPTIIPARRRWVGAGWHPPAP